jgi:Phage tail protein (Tail_P2_I)
MTNSITNSALNNTQLVNQENRDRLYKLLPAIYRIRDELEGDRALQAMMAMIEAELDIVETDIGNLYENWFIETCEAWVVPYLGDLLAVQDLDVDQPLTYGQQERRAYVANTLAYRQRKGTTPVLEQLARDITGWGARVVESQPFLSTTQQINHLRSHTQTINLRQDRIPDRIATPFERQVSYSADIGQRRGDRSRYNPGNISLYLWRLQSYPIERGIARAIASNNASSADRIFTFNPLRLSVPLLNIPQTEVELTTIATEINLPSLLKREALATELDQRRSDAKTGLPIDPGGYFGDRPVIEIWAVTGQTQQWIRPEEMIALAIDLNTLPTIPESDPEIQVAIDPETGRLAWLAPEIPDEIRVSYAYGFSSDVGGGPYDRPNAATEGLSIVTDWILHVDPRRPQSLAEAAQTWNAAAYIWQACTDRIYLPLKRITRTEDGLKLLDVTQVSPDRGLQMRPGILKGLTVIAKIGDLEATLLPGIAIDGNGRSMQITARHSILLDGNYNTVVLLLSHIQVADWQIHWQIDIVSPEVADREYDPRFYLRLAQLELDKNSRITQINNGDRQTFAPGIIRGLQVRLIDNTNNSTNGNITDKQIEIAEGQAVNREGKLWVLPRQVYSLPSEGLSIWEGAQMKLGQIALLYLAETESGNPQIKITADIETGIILVPSNQTYNIKINDSNLTFHIPSGKTLKLVAIDGDRPHINGQISLHGLSNSDTSDCGEFHLEGILLEGGMMVLAGNLKRLRLRHSTLFPQIGGLTVHKAELDIEDEDTDDFTLVALLIFAMTLFRRLIRVGFHDHHLTSSQKLDRSSQLTLQQIVNLAQAIRQVWTHCTFPKLEDNPASDGDWIGSEPSLDLLETDNSQLEISIKHCICGTINLAETIPCLSITSSIIDSVIDSAISDGTELITPAIDAPGTHTNIIQSTIIGTAWVRSIEATDSLFTDNLTTLRQQVGCIRFSHVPAGSQTPSRYQCQPDVTIAKEIQRPGSPIAALAIAPQQRFAATLGEGVFYFDDTNPIWIPINHGLSTLQVSALLVETPESGPPVTLFAGTIDGHLFTTTLPIQPRKIDAEITSRALRVMGKTTRFTRDLALQDRITIGDETRTVTDIQSDTELQIDAPFRQDLSQIPTTSFWVTRVMWQPVTRLSNTQITTLYQIPNTAILIAGTIGAGIWRSIDRGLTWECSSAGLRHLGVRSICHNPVKKLLLAGTSGGGVFYSLNQGQSWLGGDPADPTIQQTGLPDPNITTLATNPVTGGLYAGTQGGGIFRSIDGGQRWSAINEGLTDLNITVLLCQTIAGRGTISSDYNQVMGSDPNFVDDFRVGDWLTIRRGSHIESRSIIEIDRQNPTRPTLLVNDAFDPDIPAGSEFTLTTLIAIGATGQVFRSNNEGVSWQVISTNRNDPDITCWCLTDSTGLMLGTQVNGILDYKQESANGLLIESRSSTIEWRSNNRGLNQIDELVRVIQRLQPEFTTLNYGEPGYAQLTTTSPRELSQGAENGSEMGVFNDLKNPQRANNLRVSLKEYLRFGLQADLIYIT